MSSGVTDLSETVKRLKSFTSDDQSWWLYKDVVTRPDIIAVLDELERVTARLAEKDGAYLRALGREVLADGRTSMVLEKLNETLAKVTSLERELAEAHHLRTCADTLARYALQTDSYHSGRDHDFRDAVDTVVELTIKRAHSPAAKEAE